MSSFNRSAFLAAESFHLPITKIFCKTLKIFSFVSVLKARAAVPRRDRKVETKSPKSIQKRPNEIKKLAKNDPKV